MEYSVYSIPKFFTLNNTVKNLRKCGLITDFSPKYSLIFSNVKDSSKCLIRNFFNYLSILELIRRAYYFNYNPKISSNILNLTAFDSELLYINPNDINLIFDLLISDRYLESLLKRFNEFYLFKGGKLINNVDLFLNYLSSDYDNSILNSNNLLTGSRRYKKYFIVREHSHYYDFYFYTYYNTIENVGNSAYDFIFLNKLYNVYNFESFVVEKDKTSYINNLSSQINDIIVGQIKEYINIDKYFVKSNYIFINPNILLQDLALFIPLMFKYDSASAKIDTSKMYIVDMLVNKLYEIIKSKIKSNLNIVSKYIYNLQTYLIYSIIAKIDAILTYVSVSVLKVLVNELFQIQINYFGIGKQLGLLNKEILCDYLSSWMINLSTRTFTNLMVLNTVSNTGNVKYSSDIFDDMYILLTKYEEIKSNIVNYDCDVIYDKFLSILSEYFEYVSRFDNDTDISNNMVGVNISPDAVLISLALSF